MKLRTGLAVGVCALMVVAVPASSWASPGGKATANRWPANGL